MVIFLLQKERRVGHGKQYLSYLFHQGTNPIGEGPTLGIESPPKDPTPDRMTLRIRNFIYERQRDATIQSIIPFICQREQSQGIHPTCKFCASGGAEFGFSPQGSDPLRDSSGSLAIYQKSLPPTRSALSPLYVTTAFHR